MKRLVIAALCALAFIACKKKENKAEPAAGSGSAVTGAAGPGAATGSAAAGPAVTGSAAAGSAGAGSAAAATGSSSADRGEACMKECMKWGPEGEGSPFVEDWKKKSKDEQEGACGAACADANMPDDHGPDDK